MLPKDKWLNFFSLLYGFNVGNSSQLRSIYVTEILGLNNHHLEGTVGGAFVKKYVGQIGIISSPNTCRGEHSTKCLSCHHLVVSSARTSFKSSFEWISTRSTGRDLKTHQLKFQCATFALPMTFQFNKGIRDFSPSKSSHILYCISFGGNRTCEVAS